MHLKRELTTIKYFAIIISFFPLTCFGQKIDLTENDYLSSTEKIVLVPEINKTIFYQDSTDNKSIFILTSGDFNDFKRNDSLVTGHHKLYFYNLYCLEGRRKYFIPIKIEKNLYFQTDQTDKYDYSIYYEFKLISEENYPHSMENRKNKYFIGFATLVGGNGEWKLEELHLSKLNYKKIEIEK